MNNLSSILTATASIVLLAVSLQSANAATGYYWRSKPMTIGTTSAASDDGSHQANDGGDKPMPAGDPNGSYQAGDNYGSGIEGPTGR